ncbi:hypothetical protein L21_2171 [Methanoculleus chikugoensis]|jgi:hypothetical protein|uniref:Uncharacterized protein n=1 Tax=Methanoculleus chikugoensis TaxID=118126 RepID=A0A1M4MN73_9EURY|nr:hypothetical protein [Methanoculleus chikugoensis]MDD4566447.1 hypothetical protein [Methanoculleus chikugoensis]SCL76248.1 hypothetical protein L21_2171 [Methanoculleus chikugoensis]
MKKQSYVLFLALFAVAALLPGSAAGGEIPINYSFDESHAEIYERMLEQNASVGEYYERACPEFLEGMPPETRAHLYNTTMARQRPPGADGEFVPPLKMGKVAIATASPVVSVCGVPIQIVGVAILGLAGIVILALLVAVALVLERVRKKE